MEEGTVIAHARSEHPLCCPVLATIWQVMMHREAFRRLDRPFDGATKLASYCTPTGKCVPLRAVQFTEMIQVHAALMKPFTGIDPSELSARSLRAGGAMALLSGGCDSDIIKLLGRWKSDAMMDYLHQQSLPVFRCLASLMFNNGHHTFLPAETVPSSA